MAANSVSSKTGVVVSDDVTFLVPGSKESVFLYIDYTIGNGTSIAVTMGSINPSVHATSEFLHAPFATGTVAPVTLTFNTSSQKRRFEIPLARGENKFLVHVAFTGGDTQIAVVDIYGN